MTTSENYDKKIITLQNKMNVLQNKMNTLQLILQLKDDELKKCDERSRKHLHIRESIIIKTCEFNFVKEQFDTVVEEKAQMQAQKDKDNLSNSSYESTDEMMVRIINEKRIADRERFPTEVHHPLLTVEEYREQDRKNHFMILEGVANKQANELLAKNVDQK